MSAGNGEIEASPFNPATTPEPRDSATPCQDFVAAELRSSVATSVLGVLDENEPLVLIPKTQCDIFDKETQQRQDTGGEGNGGEFPSIRRLPSPEYRQRLGGKTFLAPREHF